MVLYSPLLSSDTQLFLKLSASYMHATAFGNCALLPENCLLSIHQDLANLVNTRLNSKKLLCSTLIPVPDCPHRFKWVIVPNWFDWNWFHRFKWVILILCLHWRAWVKLNRTITRILNKWDLRHSPSCDCGAPLRILQYLIEGCSLSPSLQDYNRTVSSRLKPSTDWYPSKLQFPYLLSVDFKYLCQG